MNTFIIFDNGCSTIDRYTIINKETGDVFGCSENPTAPNGAGRFVGNCAGHRIVLYGAGWRQKLPAKNIIKAETDNYINNARLDPNWLGRETELRILPDAVRRWVAQLASGGRAEASRLVLSLLRQERLASGWISGKVRQVAFTQPSSPLCLPMRLPGGSCF